MISYPLSKNHLLFIPIISIIMIILSPAISFADADRIFKEYKHVIKIQPDASDGHFGLGSAYGRIGMYREAIEAYKQAIRINPRYAEAHYNLGYTYLITGNKGLALEQYKILKELYRRCSSRIINSSESFNLKL